VANKLAKATLARAALSFHRGLALPPLVFLMDDERVREPLAAVAALPRGSLVIVRTRDAVRRSTLAAATALLARRRGLVWIVGGDAELAARSGADGAHFPEAEIGEALHWRARRPGWLITCAAHSLRACAGAVRARADAVLLGPAFATKSHIGRPSLGPMRLRLLARQSVIPVYALGGIDEATAKRLKGAPLAGLAAVGALAV
jgi:thiamine-phosphate pyrophosphorylase